MGQRFSYFVIFAEMRTGSNFLEQNTNQFPDLACHGELFNPHFIGGPNKADSFGMTLKDRERDPLALIVRIKAQDPDVIPGFRFFNDHDPRILQQCLNDPACGKVILTRNALDSYVSRKIAAATNQWKLTNIKHHKTAQIEFDMAEFETHLAATQRFQIRLLNALQTSGQTAFYINYDDIHSIDVLNGLARYLGSAHQVGNVRKNLKRQNPEPLESKVTNFNDMNNALQRIDFMNLSRTPTFEPRRGAGVPQYLAGTMAPLLFMPVRGGPVEQVRAWMIAHEGHDAQAVQNGMNQKTLRDWRFGHPGFQSFTVLRHPVARAYHGFCRHVVMPQTGGFKDIRSALIANFGVDIPEGGPSAPGYTLTAHRAAFMAYLKFLKANLSEQTGIKIDPAWASQAAILDGSGGVAFAGHIIHETTLTASLAHIENLIGLPRIAPGPTGPMAQPFALDEIYDAEIEQRVRDVYSRDYLNFGFPDWAARRKISR